MTIHPPDAAVAARSFPRRWRDVFASAAGDDDQPDVLERSGAVELAGTAANTLSAAASSLGGGTDGGGGEPLERIDAGATSLADAIDRTDPDDWTPERVEVMSSGIDEVAGLLRQAESAIEAARAGRGG